MDPKAQLTGRLVAAGRALTGVSLSELVPLRAFRWRRCDFWSKRGRIGSDEESQALRKALETLGAVVISEGEGMGAGVRLKFTRQDTKQLGRLETEGGAVRSDDLP